MDFLAKMKEEMARKRKQVEELQIEGEPKKYFRRGDLIAIQEKELAARQRTKSGEDEVDDKVAVEATTSTEVEKKMVNPENHIPLTEIRRRLRERGQPIVLFGECEQDVRDRLLKIEVEQPELKEGWKNEMVSAMQDVDDELVKEVIQGTSGDARKHDIDVDDRADDGAWEKIEEDSKQLSVGDNPGRDCDIIVSFFKYILAKWAKTLNKRDDEVKKSASGRFEASIHKQTAANLKPLMTSLEKHTCNNDIRHHLSKICRILIIDRNYLEANNAYMEMAIGNAPWPVGVTRSGIHQRPGSAKSYVSNIAHVLNDETQRKYIQSIKRLMTRMQEYFPTDPSKCVEFVKTK